jgi:AbiV family abortive infection protein
LTKRKTIDQYRGKLDPQTIAEGMNAAIRNAKRFVEDAKLLLASRRYPTACALAVLSIEESGKLSQLRAIALSRSDLELRDAWKGYRDHQTKNAAWIITELAAKGARTLEDLHPIYDSNSDHPAVLDALKQIALYTDCYGKAHWSEPETVIDEQLARNIVTTAEVLSKKAAVTPREIELWIEHLSAVWNTPQASDGLLAFYRAMRTEGLTSHPTEKIESFLGLSPGKKIYH